MEDRLSDIEQKLNRDPEQPALWEEKGFLLLSGGDKGGARLAFLHALKYYVKNKHWVEAICVGMVMESEGWKGRSVFSPLSYACMRYGLVKRSLEYVLKGLEYFKQEDDREGMTRLVSLLEQWAPSVVAEKLKKVRVEHLSSVSSPLIDPQTALDMAELFYETGSLSEAKKEFHQAFLGLIRGKDRSKAIALKDKMKLVFGENSDLVKDMERILQRLEEAVRWDKVEEGIKEALQAAHSDKPNLVLPIGVRLFSVGRKQEAFGVLVSVWHELPVDQRKPLLGFILDVLEERGNYSEAVDIVEEYIKNVGDVPPYLYRRFVALLLKTGDTEKAKLWLERLRVKDEKAYRAFGITLEVGKKPVKEEVEEPVKVGEEEETVEKVVEVSGAISEEEVDDRIAFI